jgi:signal transduction histidine kinase/ligand-binding sensor domain-containing protein/AraC-like DNA-binding protein
MPPLFPAPSSVELKLEEGYIVNPLTGDSIQPIVSIMGDTFKTGVPVPVQGKIIHPDSAWYPLIIPVGEPQVVHVSSNVHKIPKTIPSIPVDNKKLRTFTLGVDTPSYMLVNPAGDTLLTGVPVPATGNVVHCIQTQSVNALPLSMKENARINLKYMDETHGMQSSYTTCVLEDRRGNLWFGTMGSGVSRYNGTSFTHFTVNEGLSNNMVLSILEDSQGNLWFGTWGGGVNMYNGETFTHFSFKDGLISNAVISICEDSQGNLWFGTLGGGASKYNGKTITNFTTNEGLTGNDVRSIIEDSQGNLWFGTNGGASVFNGKTITNLTVREGLSNDMVLAILEDSKGNLWLGTGGGLSKFNGEAFTNYYIEEGLSDNGVQSILEDSRGNLWFGTFDGGVNMYNGESFTHYTELEGLSDNRVNSILEDSRGNLWFGTTDGGVNMYNLSATFAYFGETEGLYHNYVESILEDSQGNLWFATDWGVSKFNSKVFTNYSTGEGFSHNYVHAILEDSHGNLWFASEGGVKKFNGESVTNYYMETGLSDNDVRCILEDSQGNLWFGTAEDGVSMFNGRFFTQFTAKEGLLGGVTSMLQDSRGNLWFGSWYHGVTMYDGGAFIHYTDKEGLSNNTVLSIMEDRQGKLWFGTDGGGVNIFNGETFTCLSEREGLSNNQINSILEDRDGNVWLATNQGLNCIVVDYSKDPGKGQSLNSKGSKENLSLDLSCFSTIHIYSLKDGLKKNGFNHNSVFLDSKNHIWWGNAGGGLIMLDMNTFKIPVDAPKMELDWIEINEQFADYRQLNDSIGMKIEFDGVSKYYNFPLNLKLSNNCNHLTFHFSAIDWTAPHMIRYSYLIKGVDRDWNKPTREPVADYRNLPSGTHTLYVRAIGAAQKWSEPIEYTFTIRPPWWYSWYAYGIYGLIILGIILLYRRFLLRRASLRSAIEIERIEKEKVLELDQMKSRFFANISHEFRTPLTMILGPVEGLLKRKEKELILKQEEAGMLHRNAKRLLQLINQILDISKLETGKIRLQVSEGNLTEFLKRIILSFLSLAESKNIEYKYDLQDHTGKVYFDRDKVEKIVTNLISNAFKFTPSGGEISIKMKYGSGSPNNPEITEISIRDTGRGIPADQVERIFDRFYQVSSSDSRQYEGTGIGLSLAKELTVICRGEIRVESQPGKGSLFKLILPVSRETFRDEEVIQPGEEPEDGPHLLEDIHETLPDGYEREESQIPENETEKSVILVVEDNTDLRKYISMNLAKDYMIIEAENGRDGLERAIEKIPDIIMTDLMMPEMDGIDMCNKIRDDQRTSHIPVVMLTARADKDSKLKGLTTGVDDYLIKPFDAEELHIRIHNLIQQRKNLREKFRMEFTRLDPFTKDLAGLEDDFLSRVVDSILEHLGEHDYGVEQLAGDLRFSRSQLFRKIQSLTGYAPRDFIRNIRLKQAARMFQEGHTNITEVLYSVGFNTPSHFSQSFRELFGMNPSDYLKQTR